MLDKKLFKQIRQITIPEYIYQVQTSKARITKYFHKNSGRGKVKKDILDVPKKYKAVGYDLEGYIIDANNTRIVANSMSAGTPKFIPINGQLFYSQSGGQFTRAKVVNALHEYFKQELIRLDFKPFEDNNYPIVIQMNWFAPYSHKTPDGTNMSFAYLKTFEDTLTNNGYITDDEVRYVTSSFPIYSPVNSFDDRKLVFTFYQDMRAEVQQFKLKI
jgi:hypothetical protein